MDSGKLTGTKSSKSLLTPVYAYKLYIQTDFGLWFTNYKTLNILDKFKKANFELELKIRSKYKVVLWLIKFEGIVG